MSTDDGRTVPGRGRNADAQATREARLKAALKANIARRKAQGRARSAESGPEADRSDED